MGTAANTPKLPEDVSKAFDMLPGHGVGEYHFNGHIVKLDKISVKLAEKLVEQGFPYLVKKNADKAPKKAEKEVTPAAVVEPDKK